ncbi:TetR/AcrR family transcriptional regulator [Heyndrickxia acidicola]|uniref:TetR/AcrR family transcriptional regulator n=1 Tax=Heyndrickxia acidicola TaxID=209389 RepID=A0ABU6MKH5_9BACI|nr:TetR/AcrR family transcriptional regulator [Heyndrickxia acidicola]MED1204148.1 TetR/AcrR family transcriptional regulator [Heyndrickxia acidicola]
MSIHRTVRKHCQNHTVLNGAFTFLLFGSEDCITKSKKSGDDTHAAHVGKGQFYHYFSSKYKLGLAVVGDLIQEWDQQLIAGILQSTDNPKSKLNKMLEWAITFHAGMENKPGCPIGNLAIEMCEHDETFRLKIQPFFDHLIGDRSSFRRYD